MKLTNRQNPETFDEKSKDEDSRQRRRNKSNRQKPRKLYPSGEEEEIIRRLKKEHLENKPKNKRGDIKEVGVSCYIIA